MKSKMEWNIRTVTGAVLLAISGGVCGYAISHIIPDAYEHSRTYYLLSLLQGIGFLAAAVILISNAPLTEEDIKEPKNTEPQ